MLGGERRWTPRLWVEKSRARPWRYRALHLRTRQSLDDCPVRVKRSSEVTTKPQWRAWEVRSPGVKAVNTVLCVLLWGKREVSTGGVWRQEVPLQGTGALVFLPPGKGEQDQGPRFHGPGNCTQVPRGRSWYIYCPENGTEPTRHHHNRV